MLIFFSFCIFFSLLWDSSFFCELDVLKSFLYFRLVVILMVAVVICLLERIIIFRDGKHKGLFISWCGWFPYWLVRFRLRFSFNDLFIMSFLIIFRDLIWCMRVLALILVFDTMIESWWILLRVLLLLIHDVMVSTLVIRL